MKQKRGKCWKLQIFQGKLQVFFSYLSKMEIVCSITRLYSNLFYSLFLPFFILKIFKFKYYKVFVRHSASISKFEWFEQLWCIRITHSYILRRKKNMLNFYFSALSFRHCKCYCFFNIAYQAYQQLNNVEVMLKRDSISC